MPRASKPARKRRTVAIEALLKRDALMAAACKFWDVEPHQLNSFDIRQARAVIRAAIRAAIAAATKRRGR